MLKKTIYTKTVICEEGGRNAKLWIITVWNARHKTWNSKKSYNLVTSNVEKPGIIDSVTSQNDKKRSEIQERWMCKKSETLGYY